MRILKLFLIILICFSCSKHKEKCPERIYEERTEYLSKEELLLYKPQMDIINSLGTFWIEAVREYPKVIVFDCRQIYNGLPVNGRTIFEFFKNAPLKSSDEIFEKDGYYYRPSGIIPAGTQEISEPEISIEEAIRIALTKQPQEEFCQYELCYYTIGDAGSRVPILCWILRGKRYVAYISAGTGNILSMFENIYY